jgi:hypothetical protein
MNKGSLSFRNNNPGNLRFGAFAIRYGATHESGDLLYSQITIRDLPHCAHCYAVKVIVI